MLVSEPNCSRSILAKGVQVILDFCLLESEGIQVRGLSQEKDDDADLPDESSDKRKSKSKKNRRQIKVRALLRRHRGLQRQRNQERQ